MYSTRNKGVAAFIIKHFGKEVFSKAETFDGQAFLYFDVDRNDQDLLEYVKAFHDVTDIINELKLYDSNTPR